MFINNLILLLIITFKMLFMPELIINLNALIRYLFITIFSIWQIYTLISK